VRLAVDTGGTFTDLVVEDDDGVLHLFKSPTTPDDPVRGVLDVLAVAAEALGPDVLSRSSVFVHGTTRAINAILTGTTARTAFLTTEGHPDVLLFREGGRTDPFNFTRPYPQPYIPRALTFEVPERVGAQGEVVKPLDEEAVLAICERLNELEIEAVGVCLLWSIANGSHELRVGELLAEHLPSIPYTLSHRLNPAIREYRRASSTCIDASLKPVMSEYLRGLDGRLRAAGFPGRVLIVTSNGGVLDAAAVAEAPIHSLGSGPAMAPVAGRFFAERDGGADTAVVADTGGTSYDVSLVRRGRIPWTRETWLGEPFFGHMTGFPSVDVKSVGAGGGSIAWVDEGGLLHVGPESAGSEPGPVCYARGGERPTVTDASLVLGHIDPGYFLGGAMQLDIDAARAALERQVAAPLSLPLEEAASAVMRVATEHMVRAIEEITLHQGIDPRTAVLVGGGGAAGLNSVAIARRLGCSQLIVPAVGPALSAAGALLSDLTADFAATLMTTTADFDVAAVERIVADLRERCEEFAAAAGVAGEIELSAEARYPHQIWELELPVREPLDADTLRRDFHALHEEVFAISDPSSEVELVGWRARIRCPVGRSEPGRLAQDAAPRVDAATRRAYFPGAGAVEARVFSFDELEPGHVIAGPAIVESAVTTVVVDPGATVERTTGGSLSIVPIAAPASQPLGAVAS
jgi:N-methylhydantoinase A